jgi:hypothetical protein
LRRKLGASDRQSHSLATNGFDCGGTVPDRDEVPWPVGLDATPWQGRCKPVADPPGAAHCPAQRIVLAE